jgi:energy-converting hydrogenase A subunit I
MTPEKKSGVISVIIGILGFIFLIVYSNNVFLTYMGTALSTPFIIYGVGMLLNPNTRRKEDGQIPFRGW